MGSIGKFFLWPRYPFSKGDLEGIKHLHKGWITCSEFPSNPEIFIILFTQIFFELTVLSDFHLTVESMAPFNGPQISLPICCF